jgi:hypothetical protein
MQNGAECDSMQQSEAERSRTEKQIGAKKCNKTRSKTKAEGKASRMQQNAVVVSSRML